MSKQILNCGSCLFLNRERCMERRCADLGKLPTSKACGSHKPDMFSLAGTNQRMDRLAVLADVVHSMSATDLQVLGSVLHAEKNTRKHGWKFMQKVFVRFSGASNKNFLSNFCVGYVLYADKEYVRIVGENGKMFLSVLNEAEGTTVYTVKRFKPMREAMLASKSLRDPAFDRGVRHVSRLDDVVNDDNVVLRKQVTKAKSSTDDLVSIVARMYNGQLGRSKSKTTSVKRSLGSSTGHEGGEIIMSRR